MRLSRLWSAWTWFFFVSGSEKVFTVFRSAVATWLFVFYSIRSLDLRFFYSERGLLPLEALRDTMPMQWRFSLFQLLPSDGFLILGNILFLGSLLLLAMNRCVRGASILALVLHLSFIHRNMAILYGIDLIAGYFLFYFAIAWGKELTSVALRLSQIQVCVIYAYSGLEKLKGTSWWTGEALWSVLANSAYARFDFTWLAPFSGLLAVATFLTLLWEVYFAVSVWIPRLRIPTLIMGVLVHVGIALTIEITFFAGLMILSYLCFLSEGEVRKIFSAISFFVKSRGRRTDRSIV